MVRHASRQQLSESWIDGPCPNIRDNQKKLEHAMNTPQVDENMTIMMGEVCCQCHSIIGLVFVVDGRLVVSIVVMVLGQYSMLSRIHLTM